MKRTGVFMSAIALTFGLILLPDALADSTVHGTGDVFYLIPNPGGSPPVQAGAPVSGATASIHRSTSGVTINIKTVGLDAGHAYTVWVIEVNCPFGPCKPVQLAGKIIGKSGKGNFSGHLSFNEDPSKPVQDPFGGEFHCILANHGPLNPKDMPNAIKSAVPPFSGGQQNWDQVVIFDPR
jgi:hypothetical protein